MHFEISRAFKEGKPLNNKQRAHSLFAEEPVVGGYRLSRMAPPLRADLDKMKIIWPQVRRLMDAHAVNVHAVNEDGEKRDLREFLEMHAKAVADGNTEAAGIADPVMFMLENSENMMKMSAQGKAPPADPLTEHHLAFLKARNYNFEDLVKAQAFVDKMGLGERKSFFDDANAWTPADPVTSRQVDFLNAERQGRNHLLDMTSAQAHLNHLSPEMRAEFYAAEKAWVSPSENPAVSVPTEEPKSEEKVNENAMVPGPESSAPPPVQTASTPATVAPSTPPPPPAPAPQPEAPKSGGKSSSKGKKH